MENTVTQRKQREHIPADKVKNGIAKYIFIVCACMSIIAVVGIIGYILYGSIPAFRQVGFFKFVFGTTWYPDGKKFGILPMLVNSLIVTAFSVALGGTIGVFTAIFLVFWCPDKLHLKYKGQNKFLAKLVAWLNKLNLRTVFDQVIKLLAGIPSIVYGLVGLQLLVPILSYLDTTPPYQGEGILASSILLAIMVIPTITSLSKNALEAVPEQYFEGALAMGNTKAQAVFRVVVPAARSGIISALILGTGRAIGEAMAVIWVSGNRALFPTGLFSNIRTLTVNIVMEMGYAELTLHRPALIATGFVLLIFVFIITLSLNLVPKNFKGKRGTMTLNGDSTAAVTYVKKGLLAEILKVIAIVCAVLVLAILAVIIVYLTIMGLSNLTASFFGPSSADVPTLFPALGATLELIAITLVIALPIGIGAAIFLVEYAKPGSKFVKIVRTFIDTLAGVPSIVFGLFGMIFFSGVLGLSYSVMAGALTMVLVVLPTIIRSTEEALIAVPVSFREASYGLGASKVRTIFKVVLPSAFPGIATASILAIGRIIGESAALIFTMGALYTFTGNPLDSSCSLAVLLYSCANEGYHMSEAYALAFILILLTFVLNLIVYFIQRQVKKKR